MTRKNKPKNSHTMKGVQHWYHDEFQKLGWMVLAEAKGYTDKIEHYKKSLLRLIDCIEDLIAEYEDHNRIHDLKVMHNNAMILRDYVMAHL